MKQKFALYTDLIKSNAVRMVSELPVKDRTPYIVDIRPETRRDRQNALMWVLLKKVSERVKWLVRYADGSERYELMSDVDWKNVFSASLEGEGRLARDPNSNQMVLLGKSTRVESVQWMTDMIELIYAFGAQQGINLDD